MTKPDDIDQDAWDASIALYEAVIEVEPFTSASLTIIARAIMAEREVRLQITGAMVDAGAHALEDKFSMGRPWEELCDMADAILQAALTQA